MQSTTWPGVTDWLPLLMPVPSRLKASRADSRDSRAQPPLDSRVDSEGSRVLPLLASRVSSRASRVLPLPLLLLLSKLASSVSRAPLPSRALLQPSRDRLLLEALSTSKAR